MSTLVLFHSAQGLRPAVTAFADRLRAVGHTVHTPDLYEGKVFDDLEEGAAYRDELGIPALMQRAAAAVANLPPDLVYAGVSMGAAPAQVLAATRPSARGALLLHGALPLELLGLEHWPESVPVQVHVAERDPWVDEGGLRAFVAAVPAGMVELRTYPGVRHLFTDDGSPDHDAHAADRVLAAAESFLATTAAAPLR